MHEGLCAPVAGYVSCAIPGSTLLRLNLVCLISVLQKRLCGLVDIFSSSFCLATFSFLSC